MPRIDNARPAVRQSRMGTLLLTGPSGAGKTWTALTIAQILGTRTIVFDTEARSALDYADVFSFEHVPWTAPYDPAELAANVVAAPARGYDVVIVDSFSHFWSGQGGTLDIADGRFTGWKEARPVQREAVDMIVAAEAHVLLCCRAKTAYEVQLDRDGEKKISKLGLRAQQDESLEYDVQLALDLDMHHQLTLSKSRIHELPVNSTFAPNTADLFAERFKSWLAGGELFAHGGQVAAIRESVQALPEPFHSELLKQWRVQGLPRPDLLTVSGAELAVKLIADARAAAGIERAEPAKRARRKPSTTIAPTEGETR